MPVCTPHIWMVKLKSSEKNGRQSLHEAMIFLEILKISIRSTQGTSVFVFVTTVISFDRDAAIHTVWRPCMARYDFEILVDVHGSGHRCDDGSYCKEAS